MLTFQVINHITEDTSSCKVDLLVESAQEGNLAAYLSTCFLDTTNTLRYKVHLEEPWQSSKAPWKVLP